MEIRVRGFPYIHNSLRFFFFNLKYLILSQHIFLHLLRMSFLLQSGNADYIQIFYDVETSLHDGKTLLNYDVSFI